MSYVVTSDNFVAGEFGQTVSEEDLAGCNIPALISAGHLKAEHKSAHRQTKSDEDVKEKQ